MPASSFEMYYIQDARNNFDAMRPAPVCADANQVVGQCHQQLHVSTNCYYGYHNTKSLQENKATDNDCEMMDPTNSSHIVQANSARKRSAEDAQYPQTKRLREEGMVPSTSNNNPSFLRPTHNNPDISRCLMVHMI